MKYSFVFILFITFLVLAGTAPVNEPKEITTIEQRNIIEPNGNYEYSYLLSDGTKQEVKGILKEVDGKQVYAVTGFFRYTENNVTHFVSYVADENGFHVVPEELVPAIPIIPVPVSINPKTIGSLLG